MTALVWPEDEYLIALGRAAYAVSYVEWLAIEVIRLYRPDVSLDALAGETTYQLADRVRSASKAAPSEQQDTLRSLADAFTEVALERNDILHARPGTTDDGQQRLYRWAPTKATTAGLVDTERCEALTANAMKANARFDALRQSRKRTT